MKLKVRIAGGATSQSVRIRRGKNGAVRIDVLGGAIKRVRSRGTSDARVTPAMEAAAVQEFITATDPARLGRVLTRVYEAMDRVRAAANGPYRSRL